MPSTKSSHWQFYGKFIGKWYFSGVSSSISYCSNTFILHWLWMEYFSFLLYVLNINSLVYSFSLHVFELTAWWSFWHLHLACMDTGTLILLIWSFDHLAWFYQPLEFQSLGNWGDKIPGNVQRTCTNFMSVYHLRNKRQDCYIECHWILLPCLSIYLLFSIYGGISQTR